MFNAQLMTVRLLKYHAIFCSFSNFNEAQLFCILWRYYMEILISKITYYNTLHNISKDYWQKAMTNEQCFLSINIWITTTWALSWFRVDSLKTVLEAFSYLRNKQFLAYWTEIFKKQNSTLYKGDFLRVSFRIC